MRVERFRRGEVPRGFRGCVLHNVFDHRAKMMVVRTVAIDEAVREKHSPQLVILGAGLDGRAWRMPELADALVFELDHPDSQRDKRARVGSHAADHVDLGRRGHVPRAGRHRKDALGAGAAIGGEQPFDCRLP